MNEETMTPRSGEEALAAEIHAAMEAAEMPEELQANDMGPEQTASVLESNMTLERSFADAMFREDDDEEESTDNIRESDSVEFESLERSEPVETNAVEMKKRLDHELSELQLLGRNQVRGPKALPGHIRRVRSGETVVHNVDRGSFVSPQEIERSKELIELFQSFTKKRVLSGRVVGVREVFYDGANGGSSGMQYVVAVKWKHALIYIPTAKFTDVNMNTLLERATAINPERTIEEITRSYLRSRLNADVSFIVTNIPEEGFAPDEPIIVGGSRVQANRRSRIRMWYAVDGSEFTIQEGDMASANIVAVSRNGIRVELYGVETMINSRELSWSMIQDAAEYFETGKKILIKITEIHRDEEDDYRVSFEASVKRTAPDPRIAALEMFTEGGSYVGRINYIRVPTEERPNVTPAVFVTLDKGVQCYCPFPMGSIPPEIGAKCNVTIKTQSREKLFLYGIISFIYKMRYDQLQDDYL